MCSHKRVSGERVGLRPGTAYQSPMAETNTNSDDFSTPENHVRILEDITEPTFQDRT